MEEINGGGYKRRAGYDLPRCRAPLVVAGDDSEGIGEGGPEHGLALRAEGEGGREIGLRAELALREVEGSFGRRLFYFHSWATEATSAAKAALRTVPLSRRSRAALPKIISAPGGGRFPGGRSGGRGRPGVPALPGTPRPAEESGPAPEWPDRRRHR